MKKLICLLLTLMMVMAMTACGDENKKPYEEAVAAYDAGNYEDAATKLAALGDYKDAASLLATISAEKAGVSMEVTNAEGTVSSETEYIFKDGNLIKETITYADGTVVKNYYKYNDNGLCTSETRNDLNGGKTVLNHFYEDGIKIRSIRTNPNKTTDTYEYTCDESGKILSHVLTLADGTVEEATYSYNEQGQLTVISNAASTTTYEYNGLGDVVKEAVTENGEVVCATTYAYIYTFIVSK